MFKRFAAAAFVSGSLAILAAASALPAAASVGGSGGAPGGQRLYGGASFDFATGHFVGGGGSIEPAYDASTGATVFLQTPNHVPFNAVQKISPTTGMPVNVAPIYLPVYPVGSGIDPATLNCAHLPADNCPDHGPAIAGAAMSIVPSVYGGGVLGHDHLVGIRSTGGDFNVLWEPVLVLFTNADAAKRHITTLAEIRAAEALGHAFEVPVPSFTFHCSAVSAATYWKAMPSPTVVGP